MAQMDADTMAMIETEGELALLAEEWEAEDRAAAIDAEMFAAMGENEEKMADTEAVWGETNDLLCEEMGYSPSQEVRTMADLIAAVSGEDINGIDGIAYRQLCEELMNTTMMQDREVFYRTGEMVGTVRPWGWGI